MVQLWHVVSHNDFMIHVDSICFKVMHISLTKCCFWGNTYDIYCLHTAEDDFRENEEEIYEQNVSSSKMKMNIGNLFQLINIIFLPHDLVTFCLHPY